MPHSVSRLRRAWRTFAVCAVSACLFLLWTSIEALASLLRPAFGAPLLLLVFCAFVSWHWWRPRLWQRRRGPADLRLRPLPRPALRLLVAGIVVVCVALEALFIVHLRVLPVPAEDPFKEFYEIANQPWGSLSLFAMVVVLAPVMEETIFRGWIQRPLERLWGTAPAVGWTAVLFSLMHFIPEYVLYYFAIGLVLGSLVVLTRSLWPSIALHAVFNLQSLALSFIPIGLEDELAFAHMNSVLVLSLVLLLASGIFLTGTARRVRAIVRPARTPRMPVPAELTPHVAPVVLID
jgi:membrane protease YdiL (CAAX protease family)